MKSKKQDHEALIRAILTLHNPKEAKAFLRDLLTENELHEFANRWKAARLLAESISYVEIQNQTGLSSTTIARISKWLHKGMNGYKTMLNRAHRTHIFPKKWRD